MAIVLNGTTGITTPGIIAIADGSAAAPSLTNSGDSDTGVYFPSANALAISTGGVQRILVDSNGNVGIGTITPVAALTIDKVGGSNPNFVMKGNGEQTFRFYNTAATGSARVSWKIANRINTDWSWIMYTDLAGTGKNDFTLQNLIGPAIYADSNANVAIGTTTITPGNKLQVSGVIADQVGNIRDIVNADKVAAYVPALTDNGKMINITTGGVTINSGIFSAGNNITIYNNSASAQTITQGTSVTLRLAGTATTGNRTLAQRGIATVVCVASNDFVISGSGLT
jgi:hypothetical protein